MIHTFDLEWVLEGIGKGGMDGFELPFFSRSISWDLQNLMNCLAIADYGVQLKE